MPPIRAEIAQFLDDHADPVWRQFHRLRSVQVALFWAVVAGAWVALPAFQGMVPPGVFAGFCIAFSLAICFARLTKQPGLPDV